MKTTLTRTALLALCVMSLSWLALAQAPPVTPKPVAYGTKAKLVIAKLKQGEADAYEVRGQFTYTLTAANSDDTLVGTINYTLPEDARQKIAAMSGKPLQQVPTTFTQKNVIAEFQKGTGMPIVHLEIKSWDANIVGVTTRFGRIVLDIPGRESENTRYTTAEMEALLTRWAIQIRRGASRRGIVARVIKVINGEEDPNG
ncbi:MAG: hypothetical protein HOP19_22060 [Acidobacteria bacterium]|nr:hypothetical protein [Acidobacteriota bacterium]